MKDKNNNRILIIDDNESIHDDFRAVLGGVNPDTISVSEEESIIFGVAANLPKREIFDIREVFGERVLATGHRPRGVSERSIRSHSIALHRAASCVRYAEKLSDAVSWDPNGSRTLGFRIFSLALMKPDFWLVDLKLLLCCVGLLALDLGCMDSLLVLTCWRDGTLEGEPCHVGHLASRGVGHLAREPRVIGSRVSRVFMTVLLVRLVRHRHVPHVPWASFLHVLTWQVAGSLTHVTWAHELS